MSTRAAGLRRLERIELPERYDVRDHIADGGVASVWRALDRVLDRVVALKLLADPYAYDETAVRRFEREARAGARVSRHPNIVSIYDTGVAPPSPRGSGTGTPYIVMEYLAGGSVADALGEGPIEPELAVAWIRDAASALDHAHAQGIVHRDVKPANLLLDDALRVHVGDFGIARLASEATITSTGLVLGTAAYLAPEQALGEPATAGGDRYSLGVAAYEMLVASRPFGADAWLAGSAAPRGRPPSASLANPALPAGVDRVLARGMARAPSKRWPSATEFASALEDALGATRPAPALAATRPRPASEATPMRRRWAAPVGILAAAALTAGLVIGAADRDSGSGAAARADRHLHALAAHTAVLQRRSPARAAETAASPAPTSTPATQPPIEAAGHKPPHGHALPQPHDRPPGHDPPPWHGRPPKHDLPARRGHAPRHGPPPGRGWRRHDGISSDAGD